MERRILPRTITVSPDEPESRELRVGGSDSGNKVARNVQENKVDAQIDKMMQIPSEQQKDTTSTDPKHKNKLIDEDQNPQTLETPSTMETETEAVDQTTMPECSDSSSEPVICSVDPCIVSKCDAIPEALCLKVELQSNWNRSNSIGSNMCLSKYVNEPKQVKTCQALWFTKDEVNVTDQCVNDVDLKTIDADDVNAVDTLDDDDAAEDEDEDDDEAMTDEEMEQARKAAKKDKWLARKHAMQAERRSKKLGAKRGLGKHNNMGSRHYRTSESKDERTAHHGERNTMKEERREHTTDELEARKEQRMEANSDNRQGGNTNVKESVTKRQTMQNCGECERRNGL